MAWTASAVTHMDVAESVPLTDICIEYERNGRPWRPTVSDKKDLGRQRLTTYELNEVTPCYMDALANGLSLVNVVEQSLETKVSIVSHGPTSDDKESLVTAGS